MPSPPEKPVDLKAALAEISGAAAFLGTNDPGDGRGVEPVRPVPAVKPRSLVHDRVVVGNRRAVELVAAARVTVSVDGDPGLRELFPGFDPGVASEFDVEVTIHVVGPLKADDDGLEVGAIVPAMIAAGWPFRSWPWTGSVQRRLVRELALPPALANQRPNSRDPGPDRKCVAGVACVFLARVPGSGRKRAKADLVATGEPATTDGVPFPGLARSLVREQPPRTERQHPNEGSDLSGRTRPGIENDANEPAPLTADLSVGLSRAWRTFRETSASGAGFEEFLEALADHEGRRRYSERDGDAGDLLGSFISSCRARRASAPSEAREPDERPTVPAASAIPSDEAGAWPRVRFSEQRLRWKFKHAPDFGVHERYGRASLLAFRAAIEEHVASAWGRYQARLGGAPAVAHVGQGRVVWTSPDGAFVTGYRASPDQLRWLWAQLEWRRS